MKTVLTIAGSDCSGGAGIQADIKTISAHGLYATSVITALTAQNTTGVSGIADVTPAFVTQQLEAVFTDIFPDAVKIGMVSSIPLIHSICHVLEKYQPGNIVIDPVMVSTSGSTLLSANATDPLVQKLLPLGQLLTPNIPEAEVLWGFSIPDEETMAMAAKHIYSLTKVPVLIKGGHEVKDANDLLFDGTDFCWFPGRRIDTSNTHGTGCTLSSAIACNLALGFPLAESIQRAKVYLTGALEAGLDLGKGSGPLHHMYQISR